MEVHHGASTLHNMLGLLYHEAVQLNFFCERVSDTIVMWPKAFGHVQGIQKLGETSVCLYSPIEESENTFTASLWPVEILKDVYNFSKENPFGKKIYAVFNMQSDMNIFLQSPHYAVIRPGVIVTHGPLLSTTFKPPIGINASACKLLTVTCDPCDGKILWEKLNNLTCSRSNENSEVTKGSHPMRKTVKKRTMSALGDPPPKRVKSGYLLSEKNA